MSKRVWLAQMKCPDGHCIIAAANEADDRAKAEELIPQLQTTVDGLLSDSVLNPWCGLCGAAAKSWKINLQETPFASMEEAAPALAAAEAANDQTRTLMGDLHRKQRPN